MVQLKGMNEAQGAVYKTLVYFDIFDYPLKKEELWIYLWSEGVVFDKKDVDRGLQVLIKQNKVECNDFFCVLKGRKELFKFREEKEKISRKKIKKAKRVAWILSFIPQIKGIFLCSSLGLLNAEANSDIDFLIICRKGGVWSARFWAVVILKLLNLRPKPGMARNKICLSYFIDEENLSLKKTALSQRDAHLVYLTASHIPLYEEGDLWGKFAQQNLWIKNYIPNFNFIKISEFLLKTKAVFLKKFFSKNQFKWEKKILKKIQLRIMPKELKKEAQKDNSRVIVNDKVLKLHLNDKREQVNKKWEEAVRL